ncbi:MAG: UxaA family hydrolase [Spirochaetia bacterium]
MRILILNPKDNVGTALQDLPEGSWINGILLRENIPFGFKTALSDIGEGDKIIKYGEPIGIALTRISAGELVHVHNIQGIRGRGDLL